MMTCTVCGQPMAQARSNQLTCSPKCRTRRYRLAQPRPLKGSGRLRQGILSARLVWFVKLQPDKTYELGNSIGVPPEQWDTTLELLNQLWRMQEPLDIIDMWQGQQGYTYPEDMPQEEIDRIGLGNVGDILMDEVGALRGHVADLRAVRSGASGVLARQMGHLERALGELVVQGRRYARQLLAQSEAYEVEYGPALLAALTEMRTALESCWFAVHDQVE